MNESVRNDLIKICTFEELQILEEIVQIIETISEKKQKDLIKKKIEEAIQ